MKYTSGGAFRQALETRLKDIQQDKNIPLVRLRKQVAFERFIARLQAFQPDRWILKGGLAMQLRLGVQSRTTKDIDLLNQELAANIFESLGEAASVDLGDWFVFEVGQTGDAPEDDFGGHRYQVQCRLAGKLFESFHVDVGVSDVLEDEFEYLRFDEILDFAGIASTEVPCYPITQQIAEKLHALTREYASGSSTRVKDIIDILLLAGLEDIDGEKLSRAIQATFEKRNTHPLPDKIPSLSKTLRSEFNRLSKELDLKFKDIEDAEIALANFINPILVNDDLGKWDSVSWHW